MENKNHNQHQGTGSGFLLGVIVGVILTLLFTTKKGREILKEVLEKGVEKFSNLEELMQSSYEADKYDDEVEEGDDFIPTAPIEVETSKIKKAIEKKTEVVKPQPPRETPALKSTKEINSEEVSIKTPEEPQNILEEKAPEKPKTGGKRWFRGLRRKN